MSNNEKPIELEVGGMTCGHCAMSVTRALRETPGVADASADFATGAARVLVVPGARVDDASLKAAVEEAGYELLQVRR